ncbi:MAG: nitronate monooxygenase family protein [Desulfovibrio sp.]|jgi:NAD(P)H-dependent flavin oxidoreductase YrpB (nitropropane dioxygenase family)|nr:nitronate monooxygenase family protein [Desulfovibrio sp.]
MSFPSLTIGDLIAKVPIIQGGMGVGISLHRLASAVAAEGGIGVIAGAMIGMREKDVALDPVGANSRALATEIKKAREIAHGIIGVNIMVALTDFTSLVRTSILERADIIFSGAGLPTELPKILRDLCDEKKEDFRTKLAPIVSSARAATILCKKWLARASYLPDAFVVEGPKAGGHLGYKPEDINSVEHSLEHILPEVLEAVKPFEDAHGKKIPVIAAGGVYSGEDIHRFLQMGAAGVQMGTRFVATEECDADIRFKQAYVDAKEEDIAIIKSPVGMPGRAIKNRFIDALEEGKRNFRCIFHCISTCDPEKSPYCIASALLNAMKGNLDRGFAFTGANVFKINGIITVKELMTSLQREFDTARAKLSFI